MVTQRNNSAGLLLSPLILHGECFLLLEQPDEAGVVISPHLQLGKLVQTG